MSARNQTDWFEYLLRAVMFTLAVVMLVFTSRVTSLREQVLGAFSVVMSIVAFTLVGKK